MENGFVRIIEQNPNPDIIMQPGTPHELRITKDGVIYQGTTVADAGEVYVALKRALMGYMPQAVKHAYRAGLAKRLIGEMVEEEKRQLYTCKGKGGEYELLGTAAGAGKLKLVETLAVYRDTKTGALYFRTLDDFNERMEKI